jgi:hypothetical protein
MLAELTANPGGITPAQIGGGGREEVQGSV